MSKRGRSGWQPLLWCIACISVVCASEAVAGDDYWTTGGPWATVGLFDLKVDPTDSQQVYVTAFAPAFGDSLLYRSSDGGMTWQTTWTGFGPARPFLMGPAAIALHPSGPDTVYALINMWSASTVVMRSSDRGLTWGLVPSVVDTFPFPERSLIDRDLEIAPTDPARLHAGITAGQISPGWGMLRYSNDGGRTWLAPLSVMGLPDPDSIPPVNAVAADPFDELTAYAALDSTLIKTTDGGGHWLETNLIDFGTKWVSCIALSPLEADLVYAGVYGPFPTGDGGVWRSTNGGDSWEHVLSFMSPDTVQIFGLDVSPDYDDWVFAAAREKVYMSATRGDLWVEFEDAGFVPVPGYLDAAEGLRVYLASGNAVDLYNVLVYTVTDTCPPVFTEVTEWPDTTYPGPYLVEAVIADSACPHDYGLWPETALLHWNFGHDTLGCHQPYPSYYWHDVPMEAIDTLTFFAHIPIFGDTGTISYWISGTDNLNHGGVFPAGAPEDSVYHFRLVLPTPPPLMVDVTPDTTEVSPGDDLWFEVDIVNVSDSTLTFEAWVDGYLFNGNPYAGNPVLGPTELTLTPGFGLYDVDAHVHIPAGAPYGEPYKLYVRTGEHGGSVLAQDYFQFAIVPPLCE